MRGTAWEEKEHTDEEKEKRLGKERKQGKNKGEERKKNG